MAGPLPDDVSSILNRLEARSYKTYLCRLNASRRLAHADVAWNFVLVSLSTSTTLASIGLLAKRDMYGSGGDALMVALAVLSLVASLVVSGVRYGYRARAMEENYKRIQQISVSAENLKEYAGADRREKCEKLQWEYEFAVASSENHSQRDHRKMILNGRMSSVGQPRRRLGDWAVSFGYFWLSALPYTILVVPISLLIPFGVWFSAGF